MERAPIEDSETLDTPVAGQEDTERSGLAYPHQETEGTTLQRDQGPAEEPSLAPRAEHSNDERLLRRDHSDEVIEDGLAGDEGPEQPPAGIDGYEGGGGDGEEPPPDGDAEGGAEEPEELPDYGQDNHPLVKLLVSEGSEMLTRALREYLEGIVSGEGEGKPDEPRGQEESEVEGAASGDVPVAEGPAGPLEPPEGNLHEQEAGGGADEEAHDHIEEPSLPDEAEAGGPAAEVTGSDAEGTDVPAPEAAKEEPAREGAGEQQADEMEAAPAQGLEAYGPVGPAQARLGSFEEQDRELLRQAPPPEALDSEPATIDRKTDYVKRVAEAIDRWEVARGANEEGDGADVYHPSPGIVEQARALLTEPEVRAALEADCVRLIEERELPITSSQVMDTLAETLDHSQRFAATARLRAEADAAEESGDQRSALILRFRAIQANEIPLEQQAAWWALLQASTTNLDTWHNTYRAMQDYLRRFADEDQASSAGEAEA